MRLLIGVFSFFEKRAHHLYGYNCFEQKQKIEKVKARLFFGWGNQCRDFNFSVTESFFMVISSACALRSVWIFETIGSSRPKGVSYTNWLVMKV